MKTLCLAFACFALLGCRKDGFLAAPEVASDITAKVGAFEAAPRSHLLLFPMATAEDLLGRAIAISDDGAWTIADARAPGCEVRVRRTPALYSKQFRVALSDLTAFAAGYSTLLGLQAAHGRSIEAQISIDNTEILEADTRGPCGDVIVDTVSIGRGERKLLRKAHGTVAAAAGKGPAGARLNREGATDVSDTLTWDTPQAYSFTYREVTTTEPLRVEASMPTQVTDGQPLALELRANRDAHLVVFFLEEDDAGGVLFPAPGEPALVARAGEPLHLGPFAARLRDPAKPARETLVVYAFADEQDYHQFKPEGDAAIDGRALAAQLTEQLAQVSLQRWSRTTLVYEIAPSGD